MDGVGDIQKRLKICGQVLSNLEGEIVCLYDDVNNPVGKNY